MHSGLGDLMNMQIGREVIFYCLSNNAWVFPPPPQKKKKKKGYYAPVVIL